MDIYNILRGKTVPHPIISQRIIRFLGQRDEIEKAFKIYRELKAQGMLSNYSVMQSLLYAFSRRKEYFERALDVFRQMQVLGMPMTIHEYNNLLYGCGKTADLQTALLIWNQLSDFSKTENETQMEIQTEEMKETETEMGMGMGKEIKEERKKVIIQPNSISYSSILWVLASIETRNDKISKRSFSYDVNIEKLSLIANEIYNEAQSRGLVNHGSLVTAYMAVFSNHLQREEAERIFNNEFQKFNIPKAPLAYEIMFKLYDSTRCYDSMIKLKDQMHKENVYLTYEGWRAIIRTAALSNNLKEAIDFTKNMINAGYKPTQSSLQVLRLRLIERSEEELLNEFNKLIPLPLKIREESKLEAWRTRSITIGKFLKSQYGLNAPKFQMDINDRQREQFGKLKGEGG